MDAQGAQDAQSAAAVRAEAHAIECAQGTLRLEAQKRSTLATALTTHAERLCVDAALAGHDETEQSRQRRLKALRDAARARRLAEETVAALRKATDSGAGRTLAAAEWARGGALDARYERLHALARVTDAARFWRPEAAAECARRVTTAEAAAVLASARFRPGVDRVRDVVATMRAFKAAHPALGAPGAWDVGGDTATLWELA